ncbi:MAG: S-adenosylmethionine:tRNA ribosyltransferase-isomerase, partial [Nitrospina sp.]|nr:S-adenosylmethionine:tRNA ribosyltransferase-isomerase [Nitrospina sp.]
MKHKLSDYDFDLPEILIAQKPSQRRGQSRLLVVDRKTQSIQHDSFGNLKNYLSH